MNSISVLVGTADIDPDLSAQWTRVFYQYEQIMGKADVFVDINTRFVAVYSEATAATTRLNANAYLSIGEVQVFSPPSKFLPN